MLYFCIQAESIEGHIDRMSRKDEYLGQERPAMVSVALSPIRNALGHKSPSVLAKKSALTNPTARQTTVLRQRITTLQKQVCESYRLFYVHWNNAHTVHCSVQLLTLITWLTISIGDPQQGHYVSILWLLDPSEAPAMLLYCGIYIALFL